MEQPSTAVETRQSWQVLAAVSVTMAFSFLGVIIALLPAITTLVEKDTGWSRTAITGAMAVTVGVSALASPWFGTMIDRIGARRVIIFSQVGVAIGALAIGLGGDSLAVYYGAFAVAAFAAAGLTPTSYMKILSQWFDRRRGLALGLAALGGALLSIALPVLAAQVAVDYGWRVNFLGLAACSLLIALPLQIMFVRERPGHGAAQSGLAHVGFFKTMGEIWKAQPILKWLILIFFLLGAGQTTLIFSLAPMMTDRGMSPVEAASVQSLVGISTVVGKVLGGWLYDHFRSARPLLMGLLAAVIGGVGLALDATGPAAYACALLLGLGAGVESDAPPYLVSRYFKLSEFGKISASITTIAVLALAVGPVGGSILRDVTGGYVATCLAAAGVLLVTALLVMRLPPFPKSEPDVRPADAVAAASAA